MSKHDKSSNNRLSNLTVSVYPGYALIQGSYAVRLNEGVNQFQLEGLPVSFDPSSIHVDSVEGPGKVTLRSTSFRSANLTPQTVQQRSLNKKVTVRYSVAGEESEREVKGTLLNLYGNTAIVRLKGGSVQQIQNVTGFVFKGVPEGLANTPSLSMTLEAETKGDYVVHFFYKATNFSWQADYKLVYDEKNGRVDWDGSVFVNNGSGASFEEALLKVVAGDAGYEDSNAGFETMDAGGGHRAAFTAATAAPMRAKSVRQARVDSVGQVKSYKIGKATIEDGQNQKIPFYMATTVPVQRECRLPKMHHWHASGSSEKVEQPVRNRFLFENTVENRLGTPLPAGSVAILQRDAEGTYLKSGGGHLTDTALGDKISLDIGADFDLKASRQVVDTKRELGKKLAPQRRLHGAQEEPAQQKVHYDRTCVVELYNAKPYAVEVVVEETLNDNCELIGNHGLTKTGNSDYEKRVQLGAGEKQTLTYIIRETQIEMAEEEASE